MPKAFKMLPKLQNIAKSGNSDLNTSIPCGIITLLYIQLAWVTRRCPG